MAKPNKGTQPCQLPVNGETLRAAVAWAFDDNIFASLPRHGNTAWLAADLILLAVVWVWSANPTLTGAFAEAQRWSLQVLGRVAVGSFQGFLKALVAQTAILLPLLYQQLRLRMQQVGGTHWRLGAWLPLAVDGSRVSVPRTRDNEEAFCAPRYGQGKTAKYKYKKKKAKAKAKRKTQPVQPQMWLTLLWHMGLRMPWCWKSGPSNASERHHLRDLLAQQTFPDKTLFCGDAGFTGYELWKAILDGGHSFLMRVGGNVTLLRKLGFYARERDGIVYCWPDKAAQKKQPPLVLRLLRVRVGKRAMSLLTNVLSAKELGDREAAQLYGLRWGVELQFRAFKQTFARRKLRSRTPARADVELDWSLLGLWLVQLLAVKEQVAIGAVPEGCSVGLAIAIFRELLQRWSERDGEPLAARLRKASKDSYQRKGSKEARYKPNYKDKPASGHPVVITATEEHKALLVPELYTAA